MKRTSWILVAGLAGIAGLGTWYWLTRPPPHYRAEELLPSSTWVFMDIPDVARSRAHFAQTALGRILAETEVRAFLQRPGRSILPQLKLTPLLQALLEITTSSQGELFLACTGVSISPRIDIDFLVGFDPGEPRKTADARVEALITKCRIEYPESRIEEREFEGVKYRVWIPFRKFEIAFARLGNFLLFSHGEGPLRQAILCAQGQVEKRLMDVPAFREQSVKYPNRDVIAFVNLAAAVDPLKPLAALHPSLRDQMDWFLPFRSLCSVSTFQDGGTKSHAFVTVTNPAVPARSGLQPCSRLTLRGAGPDTVFYGATTLDLAHWLAGTAASAVTPGEQAEGGFLGFLLRSFKVPLFQGDENFLSDLGPEVALVVDWKESQAVPSPSLVMQAGATRGMELVIRKLSHNLPQLLQTSANEPIKPPARKGEWSAKTSPSVDPAGSCFAVAGSTVIVSTSRDAATAIVDALEGRKARLEDQPEFQRVSSQVGSGGVMFTYCDQRRCFERVYRMIQQIEPPKTNTPAGRVTAAVYGCAKDYLNIGQLPSREKIATHLFPSVSVQWTTTNGYSKASFSPISLPSVVFGIADLNSDRSSNRRAD